MEGKSVLDLCCNTGGFAVYAAARGASEVLGVDIDQDVIAIAKGNARLNNVKPKFVQADILLNKQDLKGAAAKFAEVANDTSLPGEFRDLALLRQTAAEYDTLKPQAVVDRLRGLASKQSPWFGSAGELVAMAHLEQGRRAVAGRWCACRASGRARKSRGRRCRTTASAATACACRGWDC